MIRRYSGIGGGGGDTESVVGSLCWECKCDGGFSWSAG